MTVSVCTHMLVIWIDTVMNRDFQGERGGKGGLREIWEGDGVSGGNGVDGSKYC